MVDTPRLARAQRRELLDVDERLALGILDAYTLAWARLAPRVDALTARIAAARAAGEVVDLGWLARLDDLRALEAAVVAEVTQVARSANGAVSAAQWGAIRLAQEHAAAAMAAALGPPPPGVFFAFNPLPAEATAALIADLGPGGPLGDLLAALGPEAARSVSRALTDGVILGHGIEQIAREARSALGGNAVRATTIARTSVIRAYKDAALAAYRANDDVVKGWIWLSALSPRSCAACVGMHGSKHKLTEEFHDHPRGRCSAAPWVRSWRELGYDVPDRPQEITSGADWFAEQPAAVQRRILGEAKYRAYRAGAIGIEDLAGKDRSRAWGTTLTERSLAAVLGAERAAEIRREVRA